MKHLQRTMIRAAVLTMGVAIGGLFASAPFVKAQVEGGPAGSSPVQKPVLEVTKTADVTTAKPEDIVTYTVTVKNSGAGAALDVKLSDILPVGFALTATGKNTFDFNFLGTLEPGKTFLTSYSAQVAKDIAANGEYVNVATVSASNHDPVTVRSTVNVNIPVVKGVTTNEGPKKKTESIAGKVLGAADELPATGVGQLDVFIAILGSGLIGAGLFGLRRYRRA